MAFVVAIAPAMVILPWYSCACTPLLIPTVLGTYILLVTRKRRRLAGS